MSLPVYVLRPQPGAAATAARLAAAGLVPRVRPLFAPQPRPWLVTDGDGCDLLLLTSANAVRLAGPGLAGLAHLPAWCVGRATAAAAQSAGLTVARTGSGDAAGLIAQAAAGQRILWLAGQRHSPLRPPPGATLIIAITYAMQPTAEMLAGIDGPALIMVHSAAAASRAAALLPRRRGLHLLAISAAAARAAGDGWAAVHSAPTPDDAAMVASAMQLCHHHAIQTASKS